MANYSTLKTAIQQVIKQNGNNEITGNVMQQTLLAMVNSLGAGYQFVGGATPATNPGTPDNNVFYLATENGTYTNFGGIVVSDEIALLAWDGSWSKTSVPTSSYVRIVNTNPGGQQYLDILISNDNLALRIDMIGAYSGGDFEIYAGSLIVNIAELSGWYDTAYYYGSKLEKLLDGIELVQEDETNNIYLRLTAQANNDFIIFNIYPLDENFSSAELSTASSYTQVALITPKIILDESAIGKRGVISQTQTWADDYGSYTIAEESKVYGIIPHSFIDRWKSLVYSWGTFNDISGYFELNGLTDISYNEALDIVNRYNPAQSSEGWRPNSIFTSDYFRARTSIPCISVVGTYPFLTWNTWLECAHFSYLDSSEFTSFIQYGCCRLRKILDKLNLTENLTLTNWYALEECYIATSKDITALQSKYLSLASIVYMVNNATNTVPVFYAFHADAYARCQADTTEYLYNGQTYIGILALAAAHNIIITI